MVKRTQYWQDPKTQAAVRDGTPALAENFADVEQYLLPMERLRTVALYGWGIADGLRVTATPGATGVTVGLGTAFDADGRQLVVAQGGAVVVDQRVAADQIQNVPTVMAGPDGATVDTAGLSGELLVTIAWREVLGDNDFVNASAWVHAPWLQLLPPAGFSDAGRRVVLARLTLAADGTVADGGLTAGQRRTVGVPSGRLVLRAPRAAGGGGDPLSVDQPAVAELAPGEDGDVVLTLLGGTPARTALTIEQATGATRVPGALAVGGAATFEGPLAAAGHISGTSLSVSGAVTARDLTAAALSGTSLSVSGAVTAGAVTAAAISGMSLSMSGAVTAGDITAAGVFSAGSVDVGGAGGNPGFGNLAVAGGLTAGGVVEAFQYQTSGQSWLRGQVYTGEIFGHWDGNAALKLNGSDVWDAGDGWLQLRSGGGKTFLRGDVTVEGNSWLRGQVYTGEIFGHWDGKATLKLNGSDVWDAADGWLQLRSGGGKTFLRGDVTVEGNSWLRGQVYTGGVFGHWDGSATLKLFGSDIWDAGDGWLQLRSGGAKTYLRGEVWVEGALHKAGGGFQIDHPLDPEHKYLSHSFVESPDMVNLYTGMAVTGDDGAVRVELPDFFEALNRNPRFQLTTVGQLAAATVEGELRDNGFTIRTDKPGVTVSWQVTGVRQDPWAEAHRIRVVEDKPDREQSQFLHPELYGQTGERSFPPLSPPSVRSELVELGPEEEPSRFTRSRPSAAPDAVVPPAPAPPPAPDPRGRN